MSRFIFGVTRGSQVYGTATPESDIDTLAVLCEERLAEYAYRQMQGQGLPATTETKVALGDATRMDLLNFVRLSLDGNPNIVEVWFTPERHFTCNDIRIVHSLHELAPQLLTKRLLFKVLGYANSQLALIDRHDRPTGRLGEARKAIVEKYGYDTKAAAHVYRLLTTGLDITRCGKILLPLPKHRIPTYQQFRQDEFPDWRNQLELLRRALEQDLDQWDAPMTPDPTDFREFVRLVVEGS